MLKSASALERKLKMSGNENNPNILAGLNQIIKAINDLIISLGELTADCPTPVTNVYVTCTGTPGAGGTGPGGGPIIEPPPIDTPDPGEVPPGFPDGWTYEDYLDYKCRAANQIVNDLVNTTDNLSSFEGVLGAISAAALYAFINTSLLSGVLVGVMALGFSAATAASVIIAALVAILGFSIGGFAYFATLASNLSDQAEDMVCALYNSDSVEQARADTETLIDDAIVGIAGIDEFLSDQLNLIIKALMGYAVYNLLWQYDASTASYVGLIDCGDCGSEEGLILDFRTSSYDFQDTAPTNHCEYVAGVGWREANAFGDVDITGPLPGGPYTIGYVHVTKLSPANGQQCQVALIDGDDQVLYTTTQSFTDDGTATWTFTPVEGVAKVDITLFGGSVQDNGWKIFEWAETAP
jgi:hypothetical protein